MYLRRVEFRNEDVGERGEAHVGGHDVGDHAGDGQPVTVLEQPDAVSVGVGAEAEEGHGEQHHRGRDQHDRLPLCEPHQDDQEQRPNEGQHGGDHTGQVLRHRGRAEVEKHLNQALYSDL